MSSGERSAVLIPQNAGDLDVNLTAEPNLPKLPKPTIANLAIYKNGILSNDTSIQLENTRCFRILLSIEQNPPIQQIIDIGIVPRFIEFLNRNDNPVS
jgi:hypothetical protein